MLRGSPGFLTCLQPQIRWIGLSNQTAIFSIVSMVSYASSGVETPWLECGRLPIPAIAFATVWKALI